MSSEQITVSLPAELVARLRHDGAVSGRGFSRTVRMMIERCYSDLEWCGLVWGTGDRTEGWAVDAKGRPRVE